MSEFNEYAQIRFLLSIFFLTFQLITLPHFIAHKEYRESTCFRLMFAIGLCECYQMLVMGLGPFLKYIQLWTEWVEKISGAFNESTLDLMFLLNLVLALNRLCVVVKMNVLKRFDGGQLHWERVLFLALTSICAIFFLFVTLLFLSPFCGLFLDPEGFIWSYNLKLSWTATVHRVETAGYLGLPTLCFAIYCLIVLIMRFNGSQLLTNDTSILVYRSHELRILIQSMLQFVIFIVPIAYGVAGWNPGRTALDNYGITSIATVVCCGLNPVLYLILLPKLRQQVLVSLRISKTASSPSSTIFLQLRPNRSVNAITKVNPWTTTI